MNNFIKNNYLDEIQPYIDELATIKNPKHTQEIDALIKWAYILKDIDDLKVQPKRILDLGCGQSHLPAILANRSYVKEVVALDNTKINEICKKHKKVVCILKDARTYLKTVELEYFDLIYDACAVIHFYAKQKPAKKNKDKIIKNIGLHYISSKILKLIKHNGFFISVTDVFTPLSIYSIKQLNIPNSKGKITKHDMLYVEQILDITQNAGLKLSKPFDYNTNNIFTRKHLLNVRNHKYEHHLSIANFIYQVQ